MTALIFGLAITNFRHIMEKVGRDEKVLIDKKRLREFHDEITFFIKSFFVYIGVVVSLSWKYAFFGLILVILQVGLRYWIVDVLSGQFGFTREEKTLSQVVYASGLPAFVMSQLPQIFDPEGIYFANAQLYPDHAHRVWYHNVQRAHRAKTGRAGIEERGQGRIEVF